MSITITEKAHGAAIMRLLEALGNDLPGKYFSFETGNSNSAYIITGFDPVTCVDIRGRDKYKGYPQRYAKFQQLLVDSIKGAIVIETHCISKTDCGDFLCHMTASGHKKMCNFIISACKFKVY